MTTEHILVSNSAKCTPFWSNNEEINCMEMLCYVDTCSSFGELISWIPHAL